VFYSHLDKYFYNNKKRLLISIVPERKQNKKIITFYCKGCKKYYTQNMTNLIRQGLKKCDCYKNKFTPHHKNSKELGFLYIIQDLETGLYKIGITKNIKRRFQGKRIAVLFTAYSVLGNLYDIEQYILNEYSEYKKFNLNYKSNGGTEFFKCDYDIINKMIKDINKELQ